jgi:transcriptional regulator with XRE-family HTH domain
MKNKKPKGPLRVSKTVAEEGRRARRSTAILSVFPENRTFREIMADRRWEMGCRMVDVGNAIGLSPMMIGKIENGVRNPDINYLPKIAAFLKIDLREFFYRYLMERNKEIYMAVVGDERIRKLTALPPELQDVILNSAEDLYDQETAEWEERRRA